MASDFFFSSLCSMIDFHAFHPRVISIVHTVQHFCNIFFSSRHFGKADWTTGRVMFIYGGLRTRYHLCVVSSFSISVSSHGSFQSPLYKSLAVRPLVNPCLLHNLYFSMQWFSRPLTWMSFASMYYSLLLIFSVVVCVLGQLPMDDLDSSSLLFDSKPSSSLFTDDDEYLTTTTAATLPNPCVSGATSDDLGFTQDETNLFSRRRRDNNPEACLPPVNIGADTLHLFEKPLDSLENLVLPLKEQNSDDSFYPGKLSPGEELSHDDLMDWIDEGYEHYSGPTFYLDTPESDTCKELTADRGNYPFELCCDVLWASKEAPKSPGRYWEQELDEIDERTKANQDFALVYRCIGTCLSNQEVDWKNSPLLEK